MLGVVVPTPFKLGRRVFWNTSPSLQLRVLQTFLVLSLPSSSTTYLGQPGSYYGLTVWFPDMIKHLQNVEYASRTKVFNNETFRHITFNFTLENQVHRRGEYFNDK